MSNRSEYHKQYRLKNKEKLNDYHKKYYHIKKNNDIDDKPNIEQNEKIEITTEPIKKYNFSEKRQEAFKKMLEARKEARKKKLEELKEKQGINKMDDSDNSTYLTDSEDEKKDPSELVEHVEDVTPDKDISITIKELIEDLQETREENENLRSILKNTNYLVEILNDQLISFHKQLNEMEIKNKMNDINNNEDQPEEENNYMEDGEMDNNEENQIKQQIEQEEQPAIKQIKNDIADDKFYIDRNGQKINFFDPDEVHFKKTNNNLRDNLRNDIPIIYYI